MSFANVSENPNPVIQKHRMQRPLIEARFYETYYFANMIRNILSDQFGYIRNQRFLR